MKKKEMTISEFASAGGKARAKKLTKAQLPDFLNALGFQVEE